MYQQLAVYYDEIYSFKNYERETDKIHTLIQQHKKSSGNSLLDVACGTGNHITYLKQHYNVEGLDRSPQMLKVAKTKHPDITFHQQDMCTFNLDKRFDIITCLFSAIGHVKTKTRMRRALRKMARHLVPGGVLIVEPWITPENYKPGIVGYERVDKPQLKSAQISISSLYGRISSLQ